MSSTSTTSIDDVFNAIKNAMQSPEIGIGMQVETIENAILGYLNESLDVKQSIQDLKKRLDDIDINIWMPYVPDRVSEFRANIQLEGNFGDAGLRICLRWYNKPKSSIDYRASISADELGLNEKSGDALVKDSFDTLIALNPKFKGEDVFHDLPLLKQLTPGQELLILFTQFDREVMNGGITQFFWNYPEHIFEFRDAILEIEGSKLLSSYDSAVKSLGDNRAGWVSLKKQWVESCTQGQVDLILFGQACALLQLEWFDKGYFGQEEPLRPACLEGVANYLRQHVDEFVV